MKNKKSFISLILAVLLLVPCMFVFSACGASNSANVSTYDELLEAINGNKEVVVLQADIDIPTELQVTRKLTLDLNGKKLYSTSELWTATTVSLIRITEDGELTIKGNGTMEAKQDDCYGIYVKKGKLVIENGTFLGNVSVVQVEEGSAEILGGYFEDIQKYQKKGDTQYTYTLNLIDANYKDGSGSIIVKGGEFKNFNPANNQAEGENTNFVAEGCNSVLDEETNCYKVTKND